MEAKFNQVVARFIRSDRALIALAGVMCSAVFWAPGLAGRFPFHGIRGEMLMQWVPYRIFMMDCYRAGEFPLWVPYIFGGMPFWGYSHTMSAYPVMMASLLLPVLAGTCAFYVAHVFVACWGVFRLLSRLGFGRFLSLLGTVMMVGGGWALMVFNREFYLNLASWSWLPVLVFVAMRLAETGSARWFFACAAALVMQLLTGDVEGIAYNLLTVALFLGLVRPGWRGLLERGRWVLPALAGAGAIVAAGAMWVPLLEYMPHNVRHHGVTFEVFAEIATTAELARKPGFNPLVHLVELFLPGSAVGWYTALFLSFHLVRRRSRSSALMLLAALAYLAYCMRVFPPLDHLLYRLPLVSSFMKRSQALGSATFILQYLALAGMRDFIETGWDQRTRRWVVALALVGTAGAALFFGFGVYFHQILGPRVPAVAGYLAIGWAALSPRFRDHPRRRARLIAALAVLVTHYAVVVLTAESRDRDYFDSPLMAEAAANTDPSSRRLIAGVLSDDENHLYTQQSMVTGRPEVFGWNRVPPRRYMDLIGLMDPGLISYRDGKLAGWDFVFNHPNGSLLRADAMPRLDLLDVKYFFDQNIPVRHVSPIYLSWLMPPDQAVARMVPQKWRDLRLTSQPLVFELKPGLAAVLKFNLAGDEDLPLPPGASARVEVTADGSTLSDSELALRSTPGSGVRSDEVRVDLARVAGRPSRITVKVRIAGRDDPGGWRLEGARVEDPAEPFQLIHSNQFFDLYENREALGSAWVVHRVKRVADRESALGWLARATREDLAGTVAVTEDEAELVASVGAPAGRVMDALGSSRVVMVDSGPGRVSFTVATDRAGVLVMSRNFLPGWSARVDGEERALVHADWALAGIAVGPGFHRVELSYRPAGFRLGWWMSAGSLLAAGAAILLLRKNMIK